MASQCFYLHLELFDKNRAKFSKPSIKNTDKTVNLTKKSGKEKREEKILLVTKLIKSPEFSYNLGLSSPFITFFNLKEKRLKLLDLFINYPISSDLIDILEVNKPLKPIKILVIQKANLRSKGVKNLKR